MTHADSGALTPRPMYILRAFGFMLFFTVLVAGLFIMAKGLVEFSMLGFGNVYDPTLQILTMTVGLSCCAVGIAIMWWCICGKELLRICLYVFVFFLFFTGLICLSYILIADTLQGEEMVLALVGGNVFMLGAIVLWKAYLDKPDDF